MAGSIKGYVDDTNNVYFGVGHRLSILDPMALKVSFGCAEQSGAEKYGVVNVFNDNSIVNEDKFYSWPSPGYFPVDAIDKDAMWSFNFSTSGYNINAPRYIILSTDENEYKISSSDLSLSSSYNTYCYYIPDELKSYLTDGGTEFADGKSVTVEAHGFTDGLGNSYVFKYEVNFFDQDEATTSTLKKGDVTGDGNVDINDISRIYAHIEGLQELTGEYLEAANVVGNTLTIDINDVSRIYAHIEGLDPLE